MGKTRQNVARTTKQNNKISSYQLTVSTGGWKLSHVLFLKELQFGRGGSAGAAEATSGRRRRRALPKVEQFERVGSRGRGGRRRASCISRRRRRLAVLPHGGRRKMIGQTGSQQRNAVGVGRWRGHAREMRRTSAERTTPERSSHGASNPDW